MGGFHYTSWVTIYFLYIPCIYSIMVDVTFVGGSSKKMSPSNSWSKTCTGTTLKISKSILQISLLLHDACDIFHKQWMTLSNLKNQSNEKDGVWASKDWDDDEHQLAMDFESTQMHLRKTIQNFRRCMPWRKYRQVLA